MHRSGDSPFTASGDLLERSLDAVAELYYVFATSGDLVAWNDRLGEVTGYTDAEIERMGPADFFEGPAREKITTAIATAATEEESVTVEAPIRTKDGETIPYEFSGTPVRDEDGELFIAGLGRDITERRDRERELTVKTEAISEAAMGITIADATAEDLPLTYVNDAFVEMTGYDREDFLGRNCRFLQGEETDPDTVREMRAAIRAEEPVSVDVRNYRKDGTQFWNGLHITPVENDGEVTHYIGFQSDVTARKEYEQKLLASNEKLEQFAYVASHDLQEPLRTVSSHLDLLTVEYGDDLDAEAAEYIDMAVTAADRMRSMINGLLDYSRVTTRGNEFEPVDSHRVAQEVLTELELLVAERDGTVHIGDLPTVRADPDQLGQLLQNLVENALEHGGESPTVRIEATELADAYRFSVADDGPGIPEGSQEDIFQLFESGQRDYETGEVHGIGLAVCENIVDRHGGEIWVESDDGATFYFTLPR